MTNKLTTLSGPRDLLERALASTSGLRIWFASKEEAISMRNRMNTVKTQDRKQNCKLYGLDSPLYNTSSYDGINVHIQPVEVYLPEQAPKPGQPTEGFWLYVQPETSASTGYYVEEL